MNDPRRFASQHNPTDYQDQGQRKLAGWTELLELRSTLIIQRRIRSMEPLNL